MIGKGTILGGTITVPVLADACVDGSPLARVILDCAGWWWRPCVRPYLRGVAWPLALMPFARFRSLSIARTRSAGVGRVLLLRRFQPACCISSVCPLQLV